MITESYERNKIKIARKQAQRVTDPICRRTLLELASYAEEMEKLLKNSKHPKVSSVDVEADSDLFPLKHGP